MRMHSDPYAEALLLILRLEGGWWPGAKSDPNPTMHGITQRTYDAYRKAQTLPPRSVRWIEPDEEAAIYRTYWTGAGCQHLDWPVCVVHFDCAVNSGPGNAKILGRRANYDWRRYLASAGSLAA